MTKIIKAFPGTRIFNTLVCAVALAGTSVTAGASASAFQTQCESTLQPGLVSVEIAPPSWVIRADASSKKLKEMSENPNAAGVVILGLTTSKYQINIKWGDNWLINREANEACTRPRIQVSLTVSPQTLWVASEFAGDACVYKDILDHEMRHVNANQLQLEKVADVLERELSSFLGQTVFYGKHETLRKQLEEALRTQWMPMAESLFREVEGDHARIDSPSEYSRNNVICGGAVPRIIKGFADRPRFVMRGNGQATP